MKKTDTYYLSEKQIEQTKKVQRKPLRIIISVLLLGISCISGLLLNYTQNSTVELILTFLVGIGGLGFIVALVSGFPKKGASISEEINRSEEGYFGKEK